MGKFIVPLGIFWLVFMDCGVVILEFLAWVAFTFAAVMTYGAIQDAKDTK